MDIRGLKSHMGSIRCRAVQKRKEYKSKGYTLYENIWHKTYKNLLSKMMEKGILYIDICDYYAGSINKRSTFKYGYWGQVKYKGIWDLMDKFDIKEYRDIVKGIMLECIEKEEITSEAEKLINSRKLLDLIEDKVQKNIISKREVREIFKNYTKNRNIDELIKTLQL
ncbi:MAG: hypothetical protein ACPLRZ_11460, partial [Thermovenabulum sp.]